MKRILRVKELSISSFILTSQPLILFFSSLDTGTSKIYDDNISVKWRGALCFGHA